MSLNKQMHPRNPYKDKPPDFGLLADKYAEFRSHCYVGTNGKLLLNFRDSDAVRSLARTLLLNDFGLDVELPRDCLVPRVPQRLNYILWIDDLLIANRVTDGVVGIDIGTGASCIYALLGAKNFGWRFLATDSDLDAFQVASHNVDRNGLRDYIEVLHVEADRMIKEVVRSHSDIHFTFCMCNPPFYELDESEQKFVRLAGEAMSNMCGEGEDSGRSAPHSATIARSNELAVSGGEVAFVGRLIDDSFVLQKSLTLYTSMIGKKSSLAELKKKLRRYPNVRFAVSTLSQGRTQRWVLAWTFHPDFKLSLESRDCAPLEVPLPASLRTSENSSAWLKKTLASLETTFDVLENGEFHCEAVRNTWSQQRQKRRAERSASMSRSCAERDSRCLGLCAREGKRVCSSNRSVGVLADMGVGDGRDSLSNAGNFTECSRGEPLFGRNACDVSVQAYFPSTSESHSLVRFRVCVPPQLNCLQLKWVDGSRHALHQISQYCRNQLAKVSSAGKADCTVLAGETLQAG